MRRVGNRAWKPGNTPPCKSRKPQADKQRHERTRSGRHTSLNALTSVAMSSQSTQRWTQLPTKLSSLSLLTILYNNASSAKSCNSLTQASYHRERLVDVSVTTRITLTTYPQPGLTAAQVNGPLPEPPLLAHEEPPFRSHHWFQNAFTDIGYLLRVRTARLNPDCLFINFIEIRGKLKHHFSLHNQEASDPPTEGVKDHSCERPTPEYESRAKVLTMFPCTPFKNARYLIATTNCFTQNTTSRSANARGVDGNSIRMEEGSPQ